MAGLRFEQTNNAAPAVFAYAGAGWTGGNAGNQNVAIVPASGGSIAQTTNAGDTCTITIAGGNSKTGALLGCTMRPTGATDITVKLDGALVATWNQSNPALTDTVEYYWYQSTFQPISWYATDPTGASTHTIVITAGTGGKLTTVDFVDLFDTAIGVVYGTLGVGGHSIPYGFTEASPPVQTKVSPTLGSVVGANLGMTVTINCIPGEDLTTGANTQTLTASAQLTAGSYTITATPIIGGPALTTAAIQFNDTITTINTRLSAAGILYTALGTGATAPFSVASPLALTFTPNAQVGTAPLTMTPTGITGGTLTMAATDNPQMWNNGFSPEPGWRRFATGPNPALKQRTWGQNLFIEAYTSGVWDLRSEILLMMHALNDEGYFILLDAAPDGNAANGASALKQTQTCIPTGTPNANFNFLWNGNTSILCSFANNVAGIQACLDGATPAAIPFVVSGAAGSPLAVGGAGVTFTNKTFGAPIASITNNYAGAGTETMATTVTGRNSRPASPVATQVTPTGFTGSRFTQRALEVLWRRQLNCPNGLTFWCSTMDSTLAHNIYHGVINAATKAACEHPTVKNAYYVDLVSVLANCRTDLTAFAYLQQVQPPTGVQGHPAGLAYSVVGQEVTARILQVKRGAASRVR